jgi:hypothetical protein
MNVRSLVQRFSGPLSTVYCCPFCRHVERVPKGTRGQGRGYGLRAGSQAQAACVAHIKATHADKLTSA